ncbi:MAG: molybdopterin-dependent oxidoreductase [Candidatus Binatia bacterium]
MRAGIGTKAATMRLNRREFLLGTGVLAVSLGPLRLLTRTADAQGGTAPTTPLPDYRGWEELYRQQWIWDAVVKGTHHVNCWYQRGCNWNVFVKDGVVWREEQVAAYPRTNPTVPDFNPRGCQKGACYSQRMYDASRVRYPLKRTGKRGEGKWTRVSWAQALEDIADRIIDVVHADGPGAIYWDAGGGISSGGHGVGLQRTNHLLDSVVLDINAEVGDQHPGALVTCGKTTFANSADDWLHSSLILVWGGNPLYTQIPNAHFLTEARYHGTQVVAIAPDLNASAIHADWWVPVNVGADAALGLALAQVIVAENLYNVDFVREQTDLGLLVRKDTRRFLRQSDVESGGAVDRFYAYDLATKGVKLVPQKTLALDGLVPALDGEYVVRIQQGKVAVTPVFALLRAHLQRYVPEAAATVAGSAPEVIRRLARRIAGSKTAAVMTQSNFSKFYHAVEMERAQFLVMALCGHFGRSGSGINALPLLTIDGAEAVGSAPALPLNAAVAAVAAATGPATLQAKSAGLTTEMFIFEQSRRAYAKGSLVASELFLHKFGGVAPLTGSARRWDPDLKQDFDGYLAEAVAKGWQFLPQTAPKIFFAVGGNILRRARGGDRLIDSLFSKLTLAVAVDSRLSTTALHSDYVLPAAAWYERDDITWATPLAPFSQVTTTATKPLGESKPDWEFHCLLLKAVQARALARGLSTFKDRSGEERRLDTIYDEFTFGKRYTETNVEDLLSDIVEVSSNLKGTTWAKLKEDGCARFTSIGNGYMPIGNATEIKPGETIVANTWHVQQRMPWPTLTRRLQFYIDHDSYLEFGHELPVHKDIPPVGGNLPLRVTGGHTRWSIHAAWRDSATLLHLQRGGPVMYISPVDAQPRRITDGAMVRVRNEVGSYEIQAKLSPAVRPGQVIVYHAWEPFQFRGQRSHQATNPSPINPLNLAGGYFHLQPTPALGGPGMHDRGTRVEVELART